MCGMSSSAFRAVIMFSLRLLAPVFKRTYDIISALALSAILLILEQPLYLYNSGFLFSFGAITGIAFVRPALGFLFVKDSNKLHFADEKENGLTRMLKYLKESLLTAFAIYLATLPVYVCFYHTYPVYSFLLNLVVLPLMAPLMIAGLLCLLTGLAIPVLGVIPGTIVQVILAVFRLFCEGTSLIPGRTWYLGHAGGLRVLCYLLIVIAFSVSPVIFKSKKTLKMHEFAEIIRYMPLVIAMFILCFHISPACKISMIDVGQGDGLLIEAGGSNILIDGGSSSNSKVGKYSIIPYLKYEGIGTIDIAVVTHEDTDHISGILEIMDDMEKGGITIKSLMLPEISDVIKGSNYEKLEERAKALGIPITYISVGKSFKTADDSISFTCLNPDPLAIYDGANAYSTVLYMKSGAFSALFTGDVEEIGQEKLVNIIKNDVEAYENLTLLKVAHHGSEYTTDEEFLRLLKPKYALISCGEGNSYGHPHKRLLERLEECGTTVLRTDECGEISAEFDGKKLKIRPYIELEEVNAHN
jgi:competence protein ComEC